MRCTIASTIITAPSTISPKSIAPKLMRLPLTPNKFIKIMAKSIAKGITEATISPALKFPNSNTNTNTTISPPSIKFFSTVPIALFTNSVRSINGSITTPSGNDFCICAIRCLTFVITCTKFSPFSISVTPATTSPSPFLVTAPYRVALPNCTVATSRINTGMPFTFFTTIFSISLNDFTSPKPRIK